MARKRLPSCYLVLAAILATPALAEERPDERLLDASLKKLRSLQDAMQVYHNRHNMFPPQALLGGDGKPTLSWRVALLPYLGEDTTRLYKEFQLNEPWDSPGNKKLLAKMPKVFAPVANAPKEPYATYYQVFTGPRTPFQVGKLLGPRMAHFRDGISNTILIAEAGEAVPWTKPADLVVELGKPLPKLGGMFRGAPFHVAMADCAEVHLLRRNFTELMMRRLIDPDDGQVLLLEKVEKKR